jgi:hypothetical protein
MWGIVAIFIAFIIFWVYFKRLQKQSPDVSDKLYSLSERPGIGNADTTKLLLNSSNTGTIQAFVYPMPIQKSGTMSLCNPSGSENPGEPECSSGEYNLCKCIGNDCSRCAHSGYVNLLNVSNVIRVELLGAPDASRRNAAGAQLVVRTTGMGTPILANGESAGSSQNRVQLIFEETIPLPNIPFQKWTFVTIAREGRRFDVYYNGKIVVSKRTQNVVDVRSAFGAVTAGDKNLSGKIALAQALPQKLTQPEVEAIYKAKSDTTGKPYAKEDINLMDYLPGCKGGDCVSGPKMRPTSPLLDWETQYA